MFIWWLSIIYFMTIMHNVSVFPTMIMSCFVSKHFFMFRMWLLWHNNNFELNIHNWRSWTNLCLTSHKYHFLKNLFSEPLITPSNFSLNPNYSVEPHTVHLVWDSVDPYHQLLYGKFKGYKVSDFIFFLFGSRLFLSPLFQTHIIMLQI